MARLNGRVVAKPKKRRDERSADNEKDSIGSARERGFPATAPHLGVSTADRMH